MNFWQYFSPVCDNEKIPSFENWISPFVISDELKHKAYFQPILHRYFVLSLYFTNDSHQV